MKQINHHTIDNYLLGQMTQLETATFEQKMAKSPILSKQVKKLKSILRLIEWSEDLKIRKQISRIHQQKKEAKKSGSI